MIHRLLLALVVMLAFVSAPPAEELPPLVLYATTTSAHWYSEPIFPAETWVLVHPASNTVRMGNLTATIVLYEVNATVIAQQLPYTPNSGGRLILNLIDDTWEYQGVEGFAFGTLSGG